MTLRQTFLTGALAVLLLGAAPAPLTLDFAKYNESLWSPVREEEYASGGQFVQKDGYVINDFPAGTSEKDLFDTKGGVGYAMRVLKGVTVKDGRADLELELIGRAAPSIVFRAQAPEAAGTPVHGSLYQLVIFNQSTAQADYQGVNLWKWTGQVGQGGPNKCEKLGYWFVPIPREKKIKLGVEFRGELIRVFIDGREIGGLRDNAALGAGCVGVAAVEGASKFYSFTLAP